LISSFYIHSFFFLSIDIQTFILLSIWFLVVPACSGVQLDYDLLLYILHINGLSYCVFISLPPGAATAGPRASSGAGSGPVAAVVLAPVVCSPDA
jgi:hypothetical protein